MLPISFTPEKPDEYWVLPAPPPLPYVSLSAVGRVRDKIAPPTACPLCGGPVSLVNNSEIYGKSIGTWPFAYSCQGCGEAYVGVHPDTDIPLGTMAGKELRTLRQTAKHAFHELMVAWNKDRQYMYRWLARQLELPTAQTHFGLFDTDRANQVHKIVLEHLNGTRTDS